MRPHRKLVSRVKLLNGFDSLEPRRLLAVTDPLGDGGAQDLAFAEVRSVGENLDIIVKFAPGGFNVDKSNVTLSLDVDRNPATGFPGIDAGNGDSAFIGTEFLVTLSGTDRANAQLLEFVAPPNSFSSRAMVPIQHIDDGIRMFVPLAVIGSADGILNYKVTSQEQITDVGSTGILDVMPDRGMPAATSVWVAGTGDPVLDPIGDNSPDIVSAKVRKIADEIDITVLFAPGTYNPDTTNVSLGFDTDQNPWTGHPGVTAAGTDDADLLGIEFILDVYGTERTSVGISKYTGPPINTFTFTDRIPIMHVTDGVRMRFPAAFVEDDGVLNYKVISSDQLPGGGSSGIRDVAPDIGRPAATSICTVAGDVNGDGAFDSGDLVSVLAAGKYESGREASYEEGDWNGDGVFDTSDLVYALGLGTYQASPIRDLAAVRIEYAILNLTTPFRGDVEIRGYVANVGTLDFTSHPGQQSAYLYEVPIGGQPQLVATKPFVNLTPGQEVDVVFVRPWDSSSPNEGEFPPDYRVMVAYDPDIFIDGNPLNDDQVSSNNVLTRSGTEVNDLFRG